MKLYIPDIPSKNSFRDTLKKTTVNINCRFSLVFFLTPFYLAELLVVIKALLPSEGSFLAQLGLP